jgi:ComF family protein
MLTGMPASPACVLASWLDPWLARACALCERRLRAPGAGLCRHCRLALPGSRRPRCARCGHGLAAPGDACPACGTAGFAFDAALVLADYAAPLDRLITALKFHGDMALADALGRELARALRGMARPPELLVPVPLSAARLRERGYDQAARIAGALGRAAGIPVRARLRRVRATLAQSSLPRPARLENLRGAFAVEPLATPLPERVALVDDVMTTGATLHAAALALRAAGATHISIVVAARTP